MFHLLRFSVARVLSLGVATWVVGSGGCAMQLDEDVKTGTALPGGGSGEEPPEGGAPASEGGSGAFGGSGSGTSAGRGGASDQGGSKTSGGSGVGAASGAGSTSGGVSSTGGSGGKQGSGGSSAGNGGTQASGGSSAGNGGTQASGGSSAGSGGTQASGGSSAGNGGTQASGGSGGSTNSGCGAGAVFCDDFEDGEATGWSKSGGVWTVKDVAGNSVYEGAGKSDEVWAGDTWTDQTVEAKVRVVTFGGTSDAYRAGIMARYAGSSSFYVFAFGGDGKITLRKSTNTPSGSSGTCGALDAGVDATQWQSLKMVVSGPASAVKIRTYLNGVLKHDCTTTSTTVASGRAGFLTYGTGTVAQLDDISVTTP